jgi:hypothetical protein
MRAGGESDEVDEEDRNDLPLLARVGEGWRMRGGGWGRRHLFGRRSGLGPQLESRILAQDRLLELLKGRTRLDP